MKNPNRPAMDARPTCIVIGAGIAGLLAADTLTRQGCIATIIEKAKGVGGRMATRRMGGQTFDFGAQSVHGHNPKFESLLASWERAGLVAPWQPDYSARSRDTKRPGPYYKGVPAMTSVPKYIAEGLTVHLQQNVTAVRVSGSAWSVETEHGHVFMSEALIMTAPLPQSLVLLDAGGFALSSDIQKRLRAVEYASCFALMLVLDGPSGLPAPGAMTLDGEPLSWISDNYAKGVAARPGSVTAYASESFSKQMLDEPAERVSHILQEAVKRMVSSRVVSAQLHRWRYCHPIHTLPEGFLDGGILPPLVFAGDMCGAGDCESAALSGIAAADHLHSTFCSLR